MPLPNLPRRSIERRLARQHLVHHAAERVEIAAPVDRSPAALLGAHVRRRAGPERGLAPGGRPGRVERAGDAEIGDDRLAVLEQDVLGLDVPVDDAAAVGVVERAGDLARRCGAPSRAAAGLGRQRLPQRLALDVRHDVVEQPIHGARVEQRQDVRMLQGGGDLDLAEEPLGARLRPPGRDGAPSPRPSGGASGRAPGRPWRWRLARAGARSRRRRASRRARAAPARRPRRAAGRRRTRRAARGIAPARRRRPAAASRPRPAPGRRSRSARRSASCSSGGELERAVEQALDRLPSGAPAALVGHQDRAGRAHSHSSR